MLHVPLVEQQVSDKPKSQAQQGTRSGIVAGGTVGEADTATQDHTGESATGRQAQQITRICL
ncbi:MAG: hypothetical protein AAGC55_33630 [Myxococcota bacterium]